MLELRASSRLTRQAPIQVAAIICALLTQPAHSFCNDPLSNYGLYPDGTSSYDEGQADKVRLVKGLNIMLIPGRHLFAAAQLPCSESVK